MGGWRRFTICSRSPDAALIELALERRNRFSAAKRGWKRVTIALDLSTADVVAAAKDAARRAVLADTNKIST